MKATKEEVVRLLSEIESTYKEKARAALLTLADATDASEDYHSMKMEALAKFVLEKAAAKPTVADVKRLIAEHFAFDAEVDYYFNSL